VDDPLVGDGETVGEDMIDLDERRNP